MQHFRLPLIVSAFVMVGAVLIGIVGITLIQRSGATRKLVEERASMLGGGLGVATAIVVAPFWLVAASKVGKERRAHMEASRKSKKRR